MKKFNVFYSRPVYKVEEVGEPLKVGNVVIAPPPKKLVQVGEEEGVKMIEAKSLKEAQSKADWMMFDFADGSKVVAIVPCIPVKAKKVTGKVAGKSAER